MGRPLRVDSFAQILTEAREKVPDVAITTDIMVGFPGETDQEFVESLTFIEAMDFARAHVFVYSPRPGTAAIKLPEQIPIQVARERSRQIRSTVSKSGRAFRLRFLGKVLDVLWETLREDGRGRMTLSGLTDNYIRVCAEGREVDRNTLTPVLLQREIGESIYGVKI
jgi:threonylcarbamoyladenosine tRNA methylthiotransferase MtaB